MEERSRMPWAHVWQFKWGVCSQKQSLKFLSQMYLSDSITLACWFPKIHTLSLTHNPTVSLGYLGTGFCALWQLNICNPETVKEFISFPPQPPQTVGKSSLPFKVTFCLFKNIPAVFMVFQHSPAKTLDKWIGNIFRDVGKYRLDLAIKSSFVFVISDQNTGMGFWLLQHVHSAWEADAGGPLEPGSSRPAWANTARCCLKTTTTTMYTEMSPFSHILALPTQYLNIQMCRNFGDMAPLTPDCICHLVPNTDFLSYLRDEVLPALK